MIANIATAGIARQLAQVAQPIATERLIDLPLQGARSSNGESAGHARAGLAPSEALAQDVTRRGLSVRETEKLARTAKPRKQGAAGVPFEQANADIEALERQLGDMLGLKVKISYKGEGGTVALNYSSLDQLDMICQRLSGEKI